MIKDRKDRKGERGSRNETEAEGGKNLSPILILDLGDRKPFLPTHTLNTDRYHDRRVHGLIIIIAY